MPPSRTGPPHPLSLPLLRLPPSQGYEGEIESARERCESGGECEHERGCERDERWERGESEGDEERLERQREADRRHSRGIVRGRGG